MRGTKEEEEEEEEEEDGEEQESKIRGPTSDDGERLRVATKTAKVKWKRKIVFLKVHLPLS